MPKKKITAHLMVAVLRAARELCFTVIQNRKHKNAKLTKDKRFKRLDLGKKEKG